MLVDNKPDAKLLKVKKAYSSPTWWYDFRGYFILKLTYQDSLLKQIRFFSKNVGGQHLEAAIGTGTLAKMIYFYSVYIQRKPKWHGIGFDYSESMLSGAKKKFRHTPLKVIYADVSSLPAENNAFDSINVANAIHCFPDVHKALRELHRVLKPDGSLYANVILYPNLNQILGRLASRINQWGMKKGILVKPYDQNEILTAFRDSGFDVTYTKKSGNSLMLICKKSVF